MKYTPRQSQSGFSLIELLLVLAIIASMTVAAFIIYPRVKVGRDVNNEIQLAVAAKAGIRGLFTNGNYDRLSTQVAIDANLFPEGMIDRENGIIRTAWSNVTIHPTSTGQESASDGTPDRLFVMYYRNVRADACIRFVGAAAGHFEIIRVGGVVVQDLYNQPNVLLDEGLVAQRCKRYYETNPSATTVRLASR